MSIHHAAAQGFAANADGYVRGRPDYPAALVDWLKDAVGLGPGAPVADVGAGTGKFLPLLLATGAHVTAVEPVEAMRMRLSGSYPSIEVRAGAAAALPFDDACLAAIVCAQAFHWFADAPSLAEFARVLVPGGTLALVWNVRDESVPWVVRMSDIMKPHEADTPRFSDGAWRAIFPTPGFGPLRESVFPHSHVGAPERVVVDRVMSVSFIAALPDDARAGVAAALRHLIASEPSLAGRSTIEVPYRTLAYHARRE